MEEKHWSPAAMPEQTGRTALITGATSGVGFYTAQFLAERGARVLLSGRSRENLDQAVAAIRAKVPDAHLETFLIDLADITSVRRAAVKIADTATIDILINNAGVMNVPKRETTVAGFEMTFGINYLGHFVLTRELMPAIRRSNAARIVTVSAIAASWPSGKLVDLMSERTYRPMRAYAKSKRAGIVFTRELAKRLKDTRIEAIAVHPGSAMTNLQRYSHGPLMNALGRLAEILLMGSPEAAAWPSLYAATSPEVHSGDYIGPAGRRQDSGTPKRVPMPRDADDPVLGDWLWRMSEHLTGTTFAT